MNVNDIPVIAIASTDCNISNVQHPILANDATTSSVRFLLGSLRDAKWRIIRAFRGGLYGSLDSNLIACFGLQKRNGWKCEIAC